MTTKERIVLMVLFATTLASLMILIHMISQNRKYKERMIMMTQYAATLEALDDFECGVLRVYELRKDGEREFANRSEGPFELWYMPYYPILGKPDIESMEVFVQSYNRKMKRMYEKKNSPNKQKQ